MNQREVLVSKAAGGGKRTVAVELFGLAVGADPELLADTVKKDESQYSS